MVSIETDDCMNISTPSMAHEKKRPKQINNTEGQEAQNSSTTSEEQEDWKIRR